MAVCNLFLKSKKELIFLILIIVNVCLAGTEKDQSQNTTHHEVCQLKEKYKITGCPQINCGKAEIIKGNYDKAYPHCCDHCRLHKRRRKPPLSPVGPGDECDECSGDGPDDNIDENSNYS